MIVCTAALVGSAQEPLVPAAPLQDDPVDGALLARPGAALGQAVRAAESGEIERAEHLLRLLGEHDTVIADYADLERLRLYVVTGRDEEAIALATSWRHADSPLRSDVYQSLGLAHADTGAEDEARAAWELALAASEDPARRAEILVQIGHSYLRSQQLDSAAERLLEVWTEHAATPSGEEAEQQLAALAEALGRDLRSAEATWKRADGLYRARHNEEALEAYERALELGGLSARAERRVRSQRAHTLFRLRRYTEAAEAFAALPQDPDNRIQQARAVARAGDPEAAARELERIGTEVRDGRGAQAKLLAALLWEGEGNDERAQKLFRTLAGAGQTSPAAASALWRLGWQAYREGRYDDAILYLAKLEERAGSDRIDALPARYWSARAAEEAGRDGVAERFGAIAREYPLSYYGWRAAARASPGASEAPGPALDDGESVLSPAELARPRILLEAGLPRAAREELDRLYERANGLDDRLVLADLYANAGDFHRAQLLVVGAYRETLARGPGAAPVELWWHAWPAPFGDAVRGATQNRGALDPALVYAIMREESGYQPTVRSVSGALGLLQLMPETAERVAAREALANFEVDDLFVPDVNIRLGAAYLDELLQRFSGRPSAAIGSYNAGPHRVVAWLDGSAAEDDEWVEAIPYEQTRGYVKRVLRSLHAYRVLY